MVDLAVENAYVLTMMGDGVGLVEDSSVLVEDGRIAAVGKSREVAAAASGAEIRIDGRGKAVLPGLVDAHIHTPLSLFRGEAQDVPETEWMIKTVAPFSRHMTEDYAVKGSALSVVEAVKSGTTLFGDYGAYMDAILRDVYSRIGVRAHVCSTINEIGSMAGQEAGELYEFDPNVGETRLEENLRLVERWHGALGGRITCCLGPQAADMMSKDLLLRVRHLAEERNLLMHFHLAQGGREALQIKARYGLSTVQYLQKIGFLSDKVMGVHCHGASDEEIAALAHAGVRMVSCPSSIALIDGKISPLAAYLKAGGRPAALGSDQACGNNRHNMFGEMKIGALLNKVREADPTVLPSWRMLRLATVEGATTLGLGDRVGTIEVGKEADLIVVDLKRPHMTPLLLGPVRNIAPNLVYSATGSEVEKVIVAGKIIVDDGHVVTVDEDEVMRQAQRAAEKIASKAAPDFIEADSRLVADARAGLL